MIKKISFSPSSEIKKISQDEIQASKELVSRMTKLANNIKSIAPKSDDFLYFSIIFLKAAEASLIDNDGLPAKIASGETAWGYFDENWKWHGNTKPHKNNNSDIFPESELKKATKEWIGLPLCRDHESSSVDGIRGIILDTHYDEKFKQVVGLCALDKINYPDLARKVETGLVRYGSMGTAVEISICSDCGNNARTQDEYCEHVLGKVAHGEINVGLKPIEYSLVVQPAEPGAVLLKCIASLQSYKREFHNYGVNNVDEMLGRLSAKQAQHLDGIMKTACGSDGCSQTERRNIVTSFLGNNGLLGGKINKSALLSSEESSGLDPSMEDVRNMVQSLKDIEDLRGTTVSPSLLDKLQAFVSKEVGEVSYPEGVSHSTGVPSTEERNPEDVARWSADAPQPPMHGGDSGPNLNLGEGQGGDLLARSPVSSEPSLVSVGTTTSDSTLASVGTTNDGVNSTVDSLSINSIMEDIMNESRLRKRAELRRRIAYHQGGADGVEPNTYKSEDYKGVRDRQDKQMLQTGNMGGDSGVFPGDSEVKQKLSRAQLEERRLRRMAYHQGGSEGVEPNTYKSEDYKGLRDNQDKQMLQTGNMGGDSGMFPGDSQVKENVHRARRNSSSMNKRAAYNGPALRTRFSVRRDRAGRVDRGNSLFEVFAGDKRVIAATAGNIFGPELNDNWEWLRSREYGQEVCKQVRASGLGYVSGLLKSAQDLGLPPLPEADEGGLPPLPPGGAGPEAGPEAGLEPLPDDLGGLEEVQEEEEEESPSEAIDGRLADMESLIDEVRDLVDQLKDQSMADVNVDVNVGDEGSGDDTGGELVQLSSNMLGELKVSMAELDESADELAMVAETYENIGKLSSTQKGEFLRLASDALRDSSDLVVQTKTLLKVSKNIFSGLTKRAQEVGLPPLDSDSDADDASDVSYAEDAVMDDSGSMNAAMDDAAMDGQGEMELVSAAMQMRRNRRNSILKQARGRHLLDRKRSREAVLNSSGSNSKTGPEDNLTVKQASPGVSTEEGPNARGSIKGKLAESVAAKKTEEDRDNYRTRLRRAYDVGLEMQKKGLLANTKTALDKQVDEVMAFDDRAFEAFKRSIGNARPVRTMKIASDLGGVNIGVEADVNTRPNTSGGTIDALASMWD